MRWLFHVVPVEDVGWGSDGRYRASSLEGEGFIHASYRDEVLEIDPRRLDVPVEIVSTPRGPMPHIRGSIPSDAIRVLGIDDAR